MINKKLSESKNFFWEGTILGEPASKANSRRFVNFGGKPRFIKSQKALSYSDAFLMQIPTLAELSEEDLFFGAKIYYASRRPDLDESLILDLLQGRIYTNDRQVKCKFVMWGLDKENPRVELFICSLSLFQDQFKDKLGVFWNESDR
jgi:Holliday junction resolvase RusA-like endonuclease